MGERGIPHTFDICWWRAQNSTTRFGFEWFRLIIWKEMILLCMCAHDTMNQSRDKSEGAAGARGVARMIERLSHPNSAVPLSHHTRSSVQARAAHPPWIASMAGDTWSRFGSVTGSDLIRTVDRVGAPQKSLHQLQFAKDERRTSSWRASNQCVFAADESIGR